MISQATATVAISDDLMGLFSSLVEAIQGYCDNNDIDFTNIEFGNPHVTDGDIFVFDVKYKGQPITPMDVDYTIVDYATALGYMEDNHSLFTVIQELLNMMENFMVDKQISSEDFTITQQRWTMQGQITFVVTSRHNLTSIWR